MDLSENWANGSLERDEGKLYFRINKGLLPIIGSDEYRYEVMFSIEMGTSNDIDYELGKLDELENKLKENMERNGKSYLGLVITGAGFRDLFFYSNDSEYVISFFENDIKDNIENTMLFR